MILCYNILSLQVLQFRNGDKMSNFNSVKKFMLQFGQQVKNKAEFPGNKIVKLRYELILEELNELKEAIEKKRY